MTTINEIESRFKEVTGLTDLDLSVRHFEKRDNSTELGRLCTAIREAGKESELDNLVSHEFPDGVEIEELEDFFKDEQEFIFGELGIKPEEDEEDDELDSYETDDEM